MNPPHTCPGCGGDRLALHPAVDPLRFTHRPGCTIRPAEDSRRVADGDLIGAAPGWEPRAPTDAERALLAACGVSAVPATTIVTAVTRPPRPVRPHAVRGAPRLAVRARGVAVLRRSFLTADGEPIVIPDAPAPDPAPPDRPTDPALPDAPAGTEPSTEGTT